MSGKKYHDSEYLKVAKNVFDEGKKRQERTGTGTISTFKQDLVFNMSDGSFPLLSIKKIDPRVVFEELMFFIRSQTDNDILVKKGVHIWTANSKATKGDLGSIYGRQWRNYGAPYKDCKTSVEGLGIDQLGNCINSIINDPNSRRMVVSAWNPADFDKMCLPPCHVLYQFYVDEGELDLFMYQRSADVGLGLPFNIASYAFLLKMVAHITKTKARKLYITTGDTHIYLNHVEQMKMILSRDPYPSPFLEITGKVEKIEDFEFDNFLLKGYEHHPFVKMEMSL